MPEGEAERGTAERADGGAHRAPPRARVRRRWLRWTLGVLIAVVLLVPVAVFAVGYAVFEIPEPDEVVHNQVAVLTHADGSEFARLVPEHGNRTKVRIGAVPAHVRHAVLAAEDRSFESNPGFDLTGILRAVWNQLQGGGGGGSTITQQYVKTALIGDAHSLQRKYEELVLAAKLTRERSKDEILEGYLNTIYFGRGAYGIESAARVYFGTTVERLDVAQSAVIAGLIPAPSRWDPGLDPEKALDRWHFVLDGMVAQGWLTPTERAAAVFPATLPREPVQPGAPADHRGHVVGAVLAELDAAGITEQDISRRGLRITTTLDAGSQAAAARAVQRAVAGQPADLRYGVVAIDPRTGGVAAYHGGTNGRGLDYARVRRLAGSTFKPFAVMGALQESPPIGLGQVFEGSPVPGLQNADGADCARCDLKQAMTISNNVVFNSLAKQIGGETVAAAARTAGITAPLDDPNEGIALGNKEVSAFELASAYATVVGGGTWYPPYFVSTVEDGDGRVLFRREPVGEVRIPPRVARNVVESMLDVAGHHGMDVGRPVAVKTGTVQSHVEGETNDAWTAGGAPELAAAVWIGTDDNSPVRDATGTPVDGAGLPAALWQEVLGGGLPSSPPVEEGGSFGPFRPIGRPPSDLPPQLDPDPSEVRRFAAPRPSSEPDLDPSEADAGGAVTGEEDAGATRDGSVPDTSVPDALVPDAFLPDGPVPDGSEPDGPVPDGSAPDGSGPAGPVLDGVPDGSDPGGSGPFRPGEDAAGGSTAIPGTEQEEAG